VVLEYNSIRAQLYNSQALMEGTNLMLYNISEGVLVIWIYVTSVGPYLSFLFYVS